MPSAGNGTPVRKSRRRAAPVGFDFCSHVRHVVTDMTQRLPQLHHIDVSRVAIAFSQARKNVSHGLFASLTPLRFQDGALVTRRRGRDFTIQRLFGENDVEMLYILRFYLPRFLNMAFREKLITILHELWHISPEFNGDLRRHPGRCYAHTHSQEEYDAQMGILADAWLSLGPPEASYQFLAGNFSDIFQRHGGMHGVKIKQPRLVPVPPAAAHSARK